MEIIFNEGDTFNYNNIKWKVTEVFKIQWDDGLKGAEYKIKSDFRIIRFIEVEYDENNDILYSFWQKLTSNKEYFLNLIANTNSNFVTVKQAKFPKEISYENTKYYYHKTNNGKYKYDFGEYEEINSVDYISKDKTKLLSIELWDDEIEISTGIYFDPSEITNIKESAIPQKVVSIAKKGFNVIKSFIFYGILILIFFTISKCSNCNNDKDDKDSNYTVTRSNGFYRARSRGSGK